MTYYAVQYRYRSEEAAAAARPAHRAYLGTLFDAGHLKASGPLVDSAYSALLIFEAADAAAVQELVDADPMSTESVLESSSITEWKPVIGVFAG